ncbi:MAG TPA: TOMM precursor leader peptide-binding protein [Kofleriaceae bacterium]|nr:TOMM precursor leader peptide-binding protein [Kofleriaceae bacterium]
MLRPRLAAAFTIVPRDDAVWLIAGEDVRITLRGDAVGSWLPELLRACDGRCTLDEVVALAPEPRRGEARAVLDALAGERIVVDGGAERAHRAAPVAWHVDGTGPLADALRARAPEGALRVFAQDTLDYAAALAVNTAQRAAAAPWLWASIGPEARALIGPLILPDTGPCLECLLDHFRLRSPVPELYDLLVAHPGPFAAATVEPAALATVADLVAWKLTLVDREPAPPALYALHVVELTSLEVSSHRVLINPECPACGTPGT